MRLRPLLLTLSASASLLGCPPTDDPCRDSVDPWIEVGEGTAGFLPIEDGAVLEVERGSQGGQHIWASVRGDGMHPGSADISEGLRKDDLPWIAFELVGPEGVQSNENLLRQPLEPLDDGGYGFLERRVPFRYWVDLPDDWQEIPREQREAELEAMDFTLRASIDDACGDLLEDSKMVRLAFPADAQ